jgi:hypothetical protein
MALSCYYAIEDFNLYIMVLKSTDNINLFYKKVNEYITTNLPILKLLSTKATTSDDSLVTKEPINIPNKEDVSPEDQPKKKKFKVDDFLL